MQQLKGFSHFDRHGVLCSLALGVPLLASACTLGSMPTLSGVGCADPSCNEVMPETRRVIRCTGEACHEPPSPSATKPAGDSASGASSDAPTAVDPSEADAPAAAESKAAKDALSLGEVKIYYESFERAGGGTPDDN